MLDEITTTVRRLEQEKNAKVSKAWVEQCITFVKKQQPSLNTKTLLDKVYEQLLVADLNLIGTGSLPADVTKLTKDILQGPFFLQINELFNISEPLETRYEDTKNRTLKLILTDGKQLVSALEDKPIPALSALGSHPGTKVLIKNVNVRHGLLFLTPTNVDVIGGVVENLLELSIKSRKESVKNLLPKEWMDELGECDAEDIKNYMQTSTQSEGNDEDEEDKLISNSVVPTVLWTKKTQSGPDIPQRAPPPAGLPSNHQKVTSNSLTSSTGGPISQKKPIQIVNEDDEDIEILLEEIEMKYQQEEEINSTASMIPASTVKANLIERRPLLQLNAKPLLKPAPSLPSAEEEEAAAELLHDDDFVFPNKTPLQVPKSHSKKDEHVTVRKRRDFLANITEEPSKKLKSDASVPKILDFNLPESPPSSPPVPSPINTKAECEDFLSGNNFSLFDDLEVANTDPQPNFSEYPFVYIINMKKQVQYSTVLVKGYCTSVVKDSFKVENGEYKLKINLDDATGRIQVKLKHEIVESLIGESVESYLKLKSSVKPTQRLKEVVDSFQAKLQNLEGIFEISTTSADDPEVIKISQHYDELIQYLLYSINS